MLRSVNAIVIAAPFWPLRCAGSCGSCVRYTTSSPHPSKRFATLSRTRNWRSLFRYGRRRLPWAARCGARGGKEGGGGRRHSCLFFFHSLRGLSGAARHNHRRHRHQASFNFSTYFDYFYEFVDECTKPSGNLVNLALVNSFINVTGTIDNLKMQFNSTVGGLNLTQFAPDLSTMFGCVSCRACLCRPAATPAHARRRSARDVAEAHRYQAKCRHCV